MHIAHPICNRAKPEMKFGHRQGAYASEKCMKVSESVSEKLNTEINLVTKKVSKLISGENLAPEKSQNQFRSDFWVQIPIKYRDK